MGNSGIYMRQGCVDAHALPDHSLLLYHTGSEVAFPLNESGAFIWEMCDGAHTLDQIVDAVASKYEAQREQIDKDTRAFLDVLIHHDLVRPQVPVA